MMCGIFLCKGRGRLGPSASSACKSSFPFFLLLIFTHFVSEPIEYASITSTGVVRKHLGRFNAPEYVDICQKKGWKVKIKLEVDAKCNLVALLHADSEMPTPMRKLGAGDRGTCDHDTEV